MKRNLKKLINEYCRKYEKNYQNDIFFVSDYWQIINISKDQKIENTLFNAVYNSLAAGFMIGYKTAKRELKKQTEPGKRG